MLKAADLRQQRAALTLKAGNLAGGIALGGTGLLDGGVGLNDLVRSMLKDGSQIGLKALELTDAALALQGTRSLAGIKPHAHQTTTAHAGAIGSHVGHTVNDGCCQRGSQIVDHVIAAEQRLDDRTITRANGQAINQAGTGGTLDGGTATHVARHQQRLTRGLLLVQGGTPGALKRISVIKQQGVDITGKQLLHQAFEFARSFEHITQATRYVIAQRPHQSAHERRAVGHTSIELLLAREL